LSLKSFDWRAVQTAAIIALVGVVWWLRVDVSVIATEVRQGFAWMQKRHDEHEKRLDDHEGRIRTLEVR
jgi:hypothetical protein